LLAPPALGLFCTVQLPEKVADSTAAEAALPGFEEPHAQSGSAHPAAMSASKTAPCRARREMLDCLLMLGTCVTRFLHCWRWCDSAGRVPGQQVSAVREDAAGELGVEQELAGRAEL
jgi:hypothetical protein